MLPARIHNTLPAARVGVHFLLLSILASSSGALVIHDFIPEERDALIQLRDNVYSSIFNLHRNWTGPPCNKNSSSRWAGVGCSDWHVTHLVLEGINLTGSLQPTTLLQNLTFLTKLSFRNNNLNGPLPNLTNLVHLEQVLLSRNWFSGSIPSGYIDLPDLIGLELQENDLAGSIPPFDQQSLVAFNVSHNHLQGKVPETPVLQRFSKSSFDNNSGLCGDGGIIIGLTPCPNPIPFAPAPVPEAPWPPSKGKNGSRVLKLWSIVVIVVAAAFVPLCMALIFLCYCRRTAQERRTKHKQQQPRQDIGESSNKGRRLWPEFTDEPESTRMELNFFHKPLLFDLDDLLRGAAQVIGRQGKLGTTYKVILECGLAVAVKRVKEMGTSSKKDFAQHMHLLGNVRHENLVEIIAFHYSKEEKLIVCEFVPDGNLFGLLHEYRGAGRMPLDWTARLSIIKDIAKALEFLHQCLDSQRVPHGNLKSSNVLIQRLDDGNFRIKLTDYGFLPLVTPQKLAVGKTPEFLSGKKPTNKADVYCFGILLLEIVTGKVPCPLTGPGGSSSSSASSDRGQGDADLSSWVRAAVNIDWSTDILDVEILGEKEGCDEMLKLTDIALECTDMVPERRPRMSHVSSRIQDMIHHIN